jgi:hypothetical protein
MNTHDFLSRRRAKLRTRKLAGHSALIHDLLAQGFNCVEIAEYLLQFHELAVSARAVQKWRRKNGVASTFPGTAPDSARSARDVGATGTSETKELPAEDESHIRQLERSEGRSNSTDLQSLRYAAAPTVEKRAPSTNPASNRSTFDRKGAGEPGYIDPHSAAAAPENPPLNEKDTDRDSPLLPRVSVFSLDDLETRKAYNAWQAEQNAEKWSKAKVPPGEQ